MKIIESVVSAETKSENSICGLRLTWTGLGIKDYALA